MIFKGLLINPTQVAHLAAKQTKEVGHGRNLVGDSRALSLWIGWDLPEDGLWKLNADEAYKRNTDMASVGDLVRNGQGIGFGVIWLRLYWERK